MMGMDNTTCPSEGPVAGRAVGITASAGRRGLGPQLAAAVRGCGLGPRPLGWLANAIGTTECESSTARGNAVCGRTACTVWEEAGGNAPMMPSPLWLAGWNIGGAPLAYLIGHSCIPTGQHPPTRRWIRAKTLRVKDLSAPSGAVRFANWPFTYPWARPSQARPQSAATLDTRTSVEGTRLNSLDPKRRSHGWSRGCDGSGCSTRMVEEANRAAARYGSRLC